VDSTDTTTYWKGHIYTVELYEVTLSAYDVYLIYDSCRLTELWDSEGTCIINTSECTAD
jgi:hypothetical protein